MFRALRNCAPVFRQKPDKRQKENRSEKGPKSHRRVQKVEANPAPSFYAQFPRAADDLAC